MCRRNQAAEIVVTSLVLGQQHQPVNLTCRPYLFRSRDGEHGTDDRLDSIFHTGIAKRHRRVESVAVVERHGREAEFGSLLCDRFRLDRAFEHRE